ncbi:hypothetical protein CPB86DRAFT_815078 [Serendipita vermifera]|nr:hypothetical protein CPB86DRAFT_815078 [Serendipita vermifera]
MTLSPYLLGLFEQMRMLRNMGLVAVTIWLYDILLTFSDELTLLWSRNGPLIKVLYIANRYIPMVYSTILVSGIPSLSTNAFLYTRTHIILTKFPQSCQITFAILIFLQHFQACVAQTIFIMRLCAVYCMQPRVRKGLIVCLIVSQVAMIIFFSFAMVQLMPSVIWEGVMWHVCMIPEFRVWAVAGGYIVPMLVDTIVFIGTVYHAIQFHRNQLGFRTSSTSEVLKSLYINGAAYYLILGSLKLSTLLVWFNAPLGYQVLLSYLEYCLSSALTSRWFLSFRRKILETQNVHVIYGTGISASITNNTKSTGSSGTTGDGTASGSGGSSGKGRAGEAYTHGRRRRRNSTIISSWNPTERRTIPTYDMEMGMRSAGATSTIGTGSAITDEDRIKSVELTKTIDLAPNVDITEDVDTRDNAQPPHSTEPEGRHHSQLSPLPERPAEDVDMVLVSGPIIF